jgi:hypothetical protein
VRPVVTRKRLTTEYTEFHGRGREEFFHHEATKNTKRNEYAGFQGFRLSGCPLLTLDMPTFRCIARKGAKAQR